MSKIMDEIEARCARKDFASFKVGDTVDVHVRIVEGDKERIQVFTGTVIAISGSRARGSFTVRRIVQGEGVERKFPFASPRVEKVVVKRTGRARRAKLHYLRQRTGKATKLAERRDYVEGMDSVKPPLGEEAPPAPQPANEAGAAPPSA